jgi:hypothetical protein
MSRLLNGAIASNQTMQFADISPLTLVLDVQGWEAVLLAIAYMALGAFLHFHFFWGRHPRLPSWSSRLKKAALLVFAFGVGYTVLRHLF